jgi:hypothetical protein
LRVAALEAEVLKGREDALTIVEHV